jgi:predicted nucleotide-binding protein
MDYDDRYQDGKNGPLKKEIRDRIAVFRTRGSTLADIGEALGFSGPFVSQLLNERRPGRVRSIHVPRIIKALEVAEREEVDKSGPKRSSESFGEVAKQQHRYPPLQEKATKPQMFVASSSENLQVAYDLQEALQDDVDVTVWKQGVFRLSRSTMESLVEWLPKCDFGAFVLVPDDVIEIRNARRETVRDNVIFELGLFIGCLGRERCFLLKPTGVDDLSLPTDLVGLTAATYDPQRQDNMLAYLGPAANRIRKEVMRLGRLRRDQNSR